MSKTPSKLDIEAVKSFDAYIEYSKNLRTWFVAYGIGGPILFVSQNDFAKLLSVSPLKNRVIYLFLVGLVLQIGIALLNKWTNWQAYALSLNSPTKLSLQNRLTLWVASQFWVDILCDILTASAFITATLYILRIALP